MYIYIYIITTKQTTTPSCVFSQPNGPNPEISSPRTVLEGHPKKNPTVCQGSVRKSGGLLSNSGKIGEHLGEKSMRYANYENYGPLYKLCELYKLYKLWK